jgi:hypothetical protein
MRRSERSRLHAQAGTTYVEVIVAVLISTVVIGLLYLALATGLRSFGRSTAAAARAAELSRADDQIRLAVSRIRAPFWPVEFVERSENEITIRYYDGDPNRTLRVSWTSEALRLVVSEGELLIVPASVSAVAIVREGERAVGLSVTFGEPPATVEAFFAGWQLP